MEQKLFTELRMLYETTKESPIVIRIRIRMRDLIDPDVLRRCRGYDDEKDTRISVWNCRKRTVNMFLPENHRPA